LCCLRNAIITGNLTYKTVISTPLGNLLIEGTADFISSVTFNSEHVVESKQLPENVKLATIQLNEYFLGIRSSFTFHMQQSGSAFQQKVWAELQKIPFGKTSSYVALARAIANEKSSRAVGNANGKNALAIVVPCHRVIGESGKLVGYAGGLWRKDWLLNHEAKIAHGVQLLF
jgi:methylated-DNA-[protein]-cysteine S-methyltransferase